VRPPGIQEPAEILHEFLAVQEEAHPGKNHHLQGRQVKVGVVAGTGAADGANDICCRWERRENQSVVGWFI